MVITIDPLSGARECEDVHLHVIPGFIVIKLLEFSSKFLVEIVQYFGINYFICIAELLQAFTIESSNVGNVLEIGFKTRFAVVFLKFVRVKVICGNV